MCTRNGVGFEGLVGANEDVFGDSGCDMGCVVLQPLEAWPCAATVNIMREDLGDSSADLRSTQQVETSHKMQTPSYTQEVGSG